MSACFRTALRTRLGLSYPIVDGIRLCESGEELQAEGILGGQHLLRCGSGSERSNTYHSIRNSTMFYIMREAGYSVRREQRGVTPIRAEKTGGRVMDCVAADPWGGVRVLADVVVADSTRSTVISGDGGGAQTRCTAGGGDEGWEVWRSFLVPDDTFVPLAIETYGCLDSAFNGILGTCARRAAELWEGGLGSVPLASRLICYY
jgi:hypothetical protein